MEFYSHSVRINNIPKYAGVQLDLLKLMQQAGDKIGKVANLILTWEAKPINYVEIADEDDTVAYVQLEDAAKHNELFQLFDNVMFESNNSMARRLHCKHMDYVQQRYHKVRVDSTTEYCKPYNENKDRLDKYNNITDRDELAVRMHNVSTEAVDAGTQTIVEIDTQKERPSTENFSIKCSARCKQTVLAENASLLECGHMCCKLCQIGHQFTLGTTIFVVCGICEESSMARSFKFI